ncbi:hypothetical protein EVAR_38612_1 [Eumeta japonica]|uniref:Uncharacterized protein n=1 Tax=Eumeta variegata TaxID=151549 RepID=A0A4C1WQH5_EUMVA|nr:hypothetical protein EVAR_38612_1 [Eumeta japonica]
MNSTAVPFLISISVLLPIPLSVSFPILKSNCAFASDVTPPLNPHDEPALDSADLSQLTGICLLYSKRAGLYRMEEELAGPNKGALSIVGTHTDSVKSKRVCSSNSLLARPYEPAHPTGADRLYWQWTTRRARAINLYLRALGQH